MKRAIFVLLLLTISVTAPPLYLQWAESQRLTQIERAKQQARPVVGERLDIILSELKNGEPPSVVILYTGSTKSQLEPCGCYQEQAGGLPRRAYVIDQIRQNGFPTLVVDAGNIFDGEEEIDAHRCEVNLKAMSAMGYDVLALSEADISYGDTYLSQLSRIATFPFLTPDATETSFTRFLFVSKKVGQHTIAFVAGSDQAQAVSEANLVVALGSPGISGRIDIVIQPNDAEAVEADGKTLYVASKPEGKTLGLLALWINAKGELVRHYATQVALTGDVAESEPVRKMLTDFYRKFAASSDATPLFAEKPLEQDPQNAYVSAMACQRCHQQEYLQWSSTRHAFAYETLLKKERYFDSGCVSCHTTGFGYQTGFQIGDDGSTFKGVQCESCHGPGKQHVGSPKKDNIRRASETSLCLTCHDTKHSPGFADVVALHTKDVDHSREPMNLEELLTSRIARMGKPTVELFVMSYCPFGVQAEEKIIPIVKRFGDKIDFKLRFIAHEKETPSPKDITPFTSLHGYPEVAESIRQLLIAQEFPDQYLDYILCRGKKLDKGWEQCAEKLGIDVAKIQRLFDTPEVSEQLFRENIKRAAELGINASPTILVDNHQFQTTQLLRAKGDRCE
ncbi:hypothetical protein F4X10_12485 [Candidatus Poribacteria bacterium]|nr:hypothetical protein [Candidatus Poribacteria bacterium]